jgi:hypothetical protein
MAGVRRRLHLAREVGAVIQAISRGEEITASVERCFLVARAASRYGGVAVA